LVEWGRMSAIDFAADDEKNTTSFMAESQLQMGYNDVARAPIMLESFS
jgi:hypothetical protein